MMNGTCGLTLLISTACCVIACSENVEHHSPIQSPTQPKMTIISGYAVFGHEVRSIRPCGEDAALWAIDSTQLLWHLHGEFAPGVEPYEEVFVVVQASDAAAPSEGFGAEYAGSLYVDRVLYVAGEGWSCDLDLSRFQFRLAGNEPFWHLVVTDSTIELNRMGAELHAWTNIRTETIDSGFAIIATRDGAGDIEVTVREQPCRDSMSGAYHAYSASVVTAGEVLTGCAIRGRDN
jgi:uncharacterized membrane protein